MIEIYHVVNLGSITVRHHQKFAKLPDLSAL
jgi:hypothetical protein